MKQAGTFEQDKCELAQHSLNSNLPTPRTVKDAVSSDVATLATIRKYMGEESAKDVLIETIGFASGLLNIGKNLQPHQIDFLADEILREWYWLKISEMKFVMLEGVRGNYGELYDCLDFRTVMQWLAKYDEQRTAVVEQENGQKVEQYAISETAIEMPEEVRELIGKFENIFLVEGESKKGLAGGEFEPDEPTLRMIEMEWADLPESGRAPYENFKALRIAQLKAQMKK